MAYNVDADIDTGSLKKLFDLTMNKDWKKVAEIYRDVKWACEVKLTKRGDTALHVALLSYICDHETDPYTIYVKKMIDYMSIDQLSVKNVKGNTPLHVAATGGWKEICKYITEEKQHWELIQRRNEMHETPLYVAAKHGEIEVFQFLQKIYDRIYKNKKAGEYMESGESLCRRRDGNTALHSAISAECFELARDIIDYYPKLLDHVNLDGESALHVLAKKTHIFGIDLGPWDTLLYNYAVDQPLPWSKDEVEDRGPRKPNLPQNYNTCFNVFSFFWKFFHNTFKPVCKLIRAADEENQAGIESKKKVGFFPANYRTLILLLKFAMSIILTVVGVGLGKVSKTMRRHKKRRVEALDLVDRMVAKESIKYGNDGQKPSADTILARLHQNRITPPTTEPIDDDDGGEVSQHTEQPRNISNEKDQPETREGRKFTRKDTAFLLAARTGISDIVIKIYEKLPIAIYDMDSKGRNVLMAAAEHRQIAVFDCLVVDKELPHHIFHHVDEKGNNIIHIAAMLEPHSKPSRIPGAALQMQWEIKWLEHVKKVVPATSLAHDINDDGSTPEMIFTEKHRDLMTEGYNWLIKTSESCSVVAALVAGVAYATTATVPGGLDQGSGLPILEGQAAFDVFSISSLISLCLSVTALVFFLSIITSRNLEKDYKSDLPSKLLSGLSCLFSSIVGMLVSFCAGHTFVLKDELKFVEVPIYALACIPITLFVLAQMPLYADLVRATWRREPLHGY